MARLEVTSVGADSDDLIGWRQYIASHPDSTVYHSLAWRTIFERSFGYRSWLLLARDTGSGAVQGILPLYLVASPFARRLVSVPFRDRGGPLWDTPGAFRALIAEAKRIAVKLEVKSIELKSVKPYPKELTDQHDLVERLYWIHSSVELGGRNVDNCCEGIGPKTRNMIRQAQNQGLTFDDSANAPACLDDWYRLHLLTQKHLGLPPFPRVFFETMLRELGRESACVVFRVRSAQETVAATILLLHKNCAIYGYSASNTRLRQYRPNDLMFFGTIRWLVRNGYAQFDLGSDAPSQSGLLFFKRKWLAAQCEVPSYSFGAADHELSDSSAGRYALLRKGFRILPLAITPAVGRLITRYFG